MPQFGDDIYLGPAIGPQPADGVSPSPMSQGAGPLGRIYVWDTVPLAPLANNLALAQAVAGAANLVLTPGAGVTRVTLASGAFGYVLDVPRCLAVVSANAGDTTQTVTYTGFDVYGAAMSARVTLNGVTPVNTLKAFKTVTQIAVSAVTVGLISSGTTSILGIPYRVTDRGYVDPSWNNTLARDVAIVVVADVTSPATLLTGDVRGTLLPSSAADGVKRLVCDISLTGLACGPQATRIGAFGVAQV